MKNIFFHSQLLGTKGRAWGCALLFALFILASAPVALSIAKALYGYHLLKFFLVFSFLFFLGYILAYFIFRLRMTNIKAYLSLVLLVGLALVLMSQTHTLEERIHLLEYSLLALLFFKACQFRCQGVLGYGIPLLLTMGVGWLDEIWQGFLPERVYDIQDILFNTCGGILGIGMVWIRRRYAP